MWHIKSPNAEISECDKQEIKKTIVGNLANSNGDIVIVQQDSMANDHEASTSKAKHRDPKYTQPRWCPPGLTKTMKTRLQHMRNHEKVERKHEKKMDEFFHEIRPMALIKQVWRPKQKENTDDSTLATPTPSPPKEDDATPITSSPPPKRSPLVEETLSPIYTLGDEDEIVDYKSMPVQDTIREKPSSSAGLGCISSAGARATDTAPQLTCSSSTC